MTETRSAILSLAGLLLLLLGSALGVIYSKYQSRLLFVEIQQQERELDRYEVEWGQLQLELTTLAEENRVEQIARDKLKLVMPERDKIIYLKP
ncbi:cell division protein FtsL [Methylotuvimicrobium alcaliphilum]|uniref:Cell division protein FtsL n=1 Tax=Methylotuvimicrobium alcaliphilum (strain DSM 19304 / NCIMB 14124 / VKM B-2133 / 20Z) TaxID=1091494 RepID=G4SWP0_META2|nr:cell division protein FtsL [Methylotuvimicrobium alcaliphilum]CCE25266.1 Cell division protein FtsL [Methylotuvimicrobium alcaliphilum 20Z]